MVSNRGFIVFLEIIIEMYYRYLMCFLCFFDYLIKYPSILCFPLTNKKAISINDFSLFSFLKVECNVTFFCELSKITFFCKVAD